MSVTHYPAQGPAWSSVATIGLPVWESVIPEPNARNVFRQRFKQTAADYSPLPLSTVYPASTYTGGATFYLVSEENFTDERAGIFSWERVYACVPTSWSEREEYAYQFPAFVAPVAFGSTFPVTAITSDATATTLSTTATSFSVPDNAYIDIGYGRGGLTYHVTFLEPILSAVGGASATIKNVLPGSGAFTSVTGTIREGSKGRTSPETVIVGSRLLHDYALTSVTGLDTALPVIDKFTPVNSSGNEVTTLSTGTATVPNSNTYAAMIDAGAEIVAEASVRQRFLGNIYVRTTRLVPAS